MKEVIKILKYELKMAKQNLADAKKCLPNCYDPLLHKIYKSQITKGAKLIASLQYAIQIIKLNG